MVEILRDYIIPIHDPRFYTVYPREETEPPLLRLLTRDIQQGNLINQQKCGVPFGLQISHSGEYFVSAPGENGFDAISETVGWDIGSGSEKKRPFGILGSIVSSSLCRSRPRAFDLSSNSQKMETMDSIRWAYIASKEMAYTFQKFEKSVM